MPNDPTMPIEDISKNEPVEARPEDRDPTKRLTHGQVATLRTRARAALFDYRNALVLIDAKPAALERIDAALKLLGA